MRDGRAAIEDLRSIGDGLSDRMNRALIDDALEYIDFNEVTLAFEVLCDQLADHRVKMRAEEVRRLIALAPLVRADVSCAAYLSKLVDPA